MRTSKPLGRCFPSAPVEAREEELSGPVPPARTQVRQRGRAHRGAGRTLGRPEAGAGERVPAVAAPRRAGEWPRPGLQRPPGPTERCRPLPNPGPAASGARRGGGNERRGLPVPRGLARPGQETRNAAPSGPRRPCRAPRARRGREEGGGKVQAHSPREPAPAGGRGHGSTGRVGPGPAAGTKPQLLPAPRPGRLRAALDPGRPREVSGRWLPVGVGEAWPPARPGPRRLSGGGRAPGGLRGYRGAGGRCGPGRSGRVTRAPAEQARGAGCSQSHRPGRLWRAPDWNGGSCRPEGRLEASVSAVPLLNYFLISVIVLMHIESPRSDCRGVEKQVVYWPLSVQLCLLIFSACSALLCSAHLMPL